MKNSSLELHKKSMSEAISLAQKARGNTAPNPMVGALVVTFEGHVLGSGYHVKAGTPHAEVLAINEALPKLQSLDPKDLENVSLVVTLEPCNHFGRTPPCVDLIVKSGIKNVFVGTLDPNPKMQGKSVSAMRDQGMTVVVGEEVVGETLHRESQKLIRGFKSVIENKRPFVTLKCATSLDGKIATSSGESQWITEEPARQLGHHERFEHDAILVGVGTILYDNPQLNVRLGDRTSVIKKVILDSQLKTPPDARVFESGDPVLIYCDWNYPRDRRDKLEQSGAIVIPSEKMDRPFSIDSLDLKSVLEDLASRGCQEILVEGGARVLGAFVREKCFDRVVYFIAPKILGSESRDVFEGVELKNLKESVVLENISARLVGKDLVIEGVRSCLPV